MGPVSNSRIHYMDNIRAFAMLLGVFFHASLAYSPLMSQVWMSASTDNASYIDFVAFYTHGWRMPLFFLVAGFFGALLYKKRGASAVIKNRSLRIALPLIIFLPLITIAVVTIFSWAAQSVSNPSPMLGLITGMLNNPDAPKPPLSTMHLWFLYYLIWFYALTLMFLFVYRKLNLKAIDWHTPVIKHPIIFLLLLPLVLVPSMLTQFSPLPAPEQLSPALWAFGFHGVFFVLGWGIYNQPRVLDAIQPFMWPLLIIGLAYYIIYYSFMPSSFTIMDAMYNLTNSPDLDLNQTIKASAEAYLSMYTVLAVLLIGKRFFDRQSKVAQFVSRSSYWVYIIHLPLVWILQFLLLDTDLPMLVEFAISAFGTIAIGMLTYVLFVSWSPIGWLLNGRQKSTSIDKPVRSPEKHG